MRLPDLNKAHNQIRYHYSSIHEDASGGLSLCLVKKRGKIFLHLPYLITCAIRDRERNILTIERERLRERLAKVVV